MIWFLLVLIIALVLAFLDDLTPVLLFFLTLFLGSVVSLFINMIISGVYDGGSHVVEYRAVKDVRIVIVNNDRFRNDVQIEATFADSTKRQFSTTDSQLVIKPGPATYVRNEANDPNFWFSVLPSPKHGENIITTPTAPSFKE